jgi:response regulator RpfG family c-di-GMP phosphodiesterase
MTVDTRDAVQMPSCELDWPTVLCIDDDPQIPEAIRLRLRRYEVHVLCAYHGMHGFWLAMTERPDLIITDMRMPQGQGDHIIDCLRHNTDTRSIPVIVLSGQARQEVARRLTGLNVEEILTKPVRFDALRAAIARYVPMRVLETGEFESQESTEDTIAFD